MSATIAHYLLARRVMEKLPEQIPGRRFDKDAFLWGAQGPDFLFFHSRPFRKKGVPLRIYGSTLHHSHPCAILESMRRYFTVSAADEEEMLSYALGFLCHYALDRTVHPFVSAAVPLLRLRQEEEEHPKIHDGLLHARIESMQDIILLRHETGKLPVEFPLKKILPKNPELMRHIGRLYTHLLQEVFGYHEPPEVLYAAVRDMRTVSGLLNDSTSFKRPLAKLIEKPLRKGALFSSYMRPVTETDDFDYSNLYGKEWEDPFLPGEVRTESLFELFDRAAEESLQMAGDFIRELHTEVPLCKMTGCLSFETGQLNREIKIIDKNRGLGL